jgi:hypothetical protein
MNSNLLDSHAHAHGPLWQDRRARGSRNLSCLRCRVLRNQPPSGGRWGFLASGVNQQALPTRFTGRSLTGLGKVKRSMKGKRNPQSPFPGGRRSYAKRIV